ncbi:MAG: hypothetical protein JO307_06360, partial [Bryobacterales bacterium]|nr:hypothetical protein [Bryobacterales bacterium]
MVRLGAWCTFDWDQSRVVERTAADAVRAGVPDAVEFARERLGFEADERQAAVLASEAKRGMLNCTRQWGKSTLAAIKAVHRAYAQPGSLVI